MLSKTSSLSIIVLVVMGALWCASAALGDDDDALSAITRNKPGYPSLDQRIANQQDTVTKMGAACKVLFIGDSITQAWDGAPGLWSHYFGDRNAINFGVGGDSINDMRSRLRDTKWGDCQPRAVVIMGGTNDRDATPEHRAARLRLLIDEVFTHFPRTKAIVVSIMPCNYDPGDALSQSYGASDEIIKTFADNKRIFYVNLRKQMVWREGPGYLGLGLDRLHPDNVGLNMWAIAMEPTLSSILGDTPKAALPSPAPEDMGEAGVPSVLPIGEGNYSAYYLQKSLRIRGIKCHFVGPYDAYSPAPAWQVADGVQQMSAMSGFWPFSYWLQGGAAAGMAHRYHPDVILLSTGMEASGGVRSDTPLDTVIADTTKLIDQLESAAPKSLLIVALVGPNTIPDKDARAKILDDALLDRVAADAAAGKRITYVDQYGSIGHDMLTSEVYLNDVGQLRLAESEWAPIAAALNRTLGDITLAPPTGLSADPGNGIVKLTWKPVRGASSYNVKRSRRLGGPYAIVGTGITSTTFVDPEVLNDVSYTYVVSACRLAEHGEQDIALRLGQGANSAAVTAIPMDSADLPIDRTGWDATSSRFAQNAPAKAAVAGTGTWSLGGDQKTGDYFQADMGTTKAFDAVEMNYAPWLFTVTVSTDGVTWDTPGVLASDIDYRRIRVHLPRTVARYIRITAQAPYPHGWEMSDFQVLANARK